MTDIAPAAATPAETPPAKERPRLAYHHSPGTGPTIVFLSGYASDMAGTKAVTLEAWAKSEGRAFLRFDYGGCGQSEGAFEDQTLVDWRDDVLAMIDALVEESAILVGSSMGGWLMLLAAKLRPDLVKGLVGIAPAPDFTDWGFTTDEKMALLSNGRCSARSRSMARSDWSRGSAIRMCRGSGPRGWASCCVQPMCRHGWSRTATTACRAIATFPSSSGRSRM